MQYVNTCFIFKVQKNQIDLVESKKKTLNEIEKQLEYEVNVSNQ